MTSCDVMKSTCRIFTKLSENDSLIDIVLWTKLVIYFTQSEFMSNFVFSGFVGKCIGKSYLLPTKTPYLDF